MKHFFTIISLFILYGCNITSQNDLVDSYNSHLPTSVSGTYQCTYRVYWPDSVVEVDSMSRWPYSDSGTYPAFLIRSSWVGTNNSCITMRERERERYYWWCQGNT